MARRVVGLREIGRELATDRVGTCSIHTASTIVWTWGGRLADAVHSDPGVFLIWVLSSDVV